MSSRPRRRPCGLLLLGLLVLSAGSTLYAASRPPVQGSGGAVSSDEHLATEAGLEILRAGGNAADAAVAVALALAVVSPEAGNLGGGGFVISRFPGADQELRFLDFREIAPAAAYRDMYLDEEGKAVRDLSWNGPLAAGVPGSPTGLYELHREQGVLDWARVVAPAIRLAAEGFAVSRRMADSLEEEKERLARFEESAAIWFAGGEPVPAGTVVRLPSLAHTLRLLADQGPSAVMEGQVAETLIATSSKYGGVLTKEDLAAYRPTWREPMQFEAFGWHLTGADLPSSGGILVSASTWMMEAGKIGATEPLSADRVHLQAESWRRAFADRYLLGDPQTTLARSSDLTDPKWLAKRWQSYDPKTATPSEKVQLWSDIRGQAKESSDTTEISVVDKDGNAVAITTTLNGLFGGALWVPGFGFLNNEMDDFAASVTEANEYGLIQGEANVVGPGKRMLSSMSPTVAWKASPEGEEILVLGGRGGSRIPTGVMQVFLAVAVDGAGLQEALDRPRVHHQWLPDLVSYEAGALSPETRAELERRGHALQARDHVAQVQAVRRRPDGTFEAGGDPRGGGGSGGVVSPVD